MAFQYPNFENLSFQRQPLGAEFFKLSEILSDLFMQNNADIFVVSPTKKLFKNHQPHGLKKD